MRFRVNIEEWGQFFRNARRGLAKNGEGDLALSAEETVEISSETLFFSLGAEIVDRGRFIVPECCAFRIDELINAAGTQDVEIAVVDDILHVDGKIVFAYLPLWLQKKRVKALVSPPRNPVLAAGCNLEQPPGLILEAERLARDLNAGCALLQAYGRSPDDVLALLATRVPTANVDVLKAVLTKLVAATPWSGPAASTPSA